VPILVIIIRPIIIIYCKPVIITRLLRRVNQLLSVVFERRNTTTPPEAGTAVVLRCIDFARQRSTSTLLAISTAAMSLFDDGILLRKTHFYIDYYSFSNFQYRIVY